MAPKVPLNLRIDADEKEELEQAAADRDLDVADIVRERLRNGKKFERLREVLPHSQWKTIEKLLNKKK